MRASRLGPLLDGDGNHFSELQVSLFLFAYLARDAELEAIAPLLDALREHFAVTSIAFHATSMSALSTWH